MYLTCGFKSIYFSFCNCFPTKLVIHLVCEHFDSVPDIGEQGRQRHSENWARLAQAQMRGTGQVRCPHSVLVRTADSFGTKARSWMKEVKTRNTRGTRQLPRAGLCGLTHEGQETRVSGDMENRRTLWWPAGRYSVPSGLRTDILGTYSIVVFKEKWESASYCLLPHSITPVLCHLLFLRSMSRST